MTNDGANGINAVELEEDAAQAALLFEKMLGSLTFEATHSAQQAGAVKFFASGVELITFKFKIGNSVDIGFTIAGKDAPNAGAGLAIEPEENTTPD